MRLCSCRKAGSWTMMFSSDRFVFQGEPLYTASIIGA